MLASLYEVIARIPSDLDSHLPGIHDKFVDWIMNQEWKLLSDSDMDWDQIEQPQLMIAGKIQQEFVNEWKKTVTSERLYLVQFEKGTKFFHLHMLIKMNSMKSIVVGCYLSQIHRKLIKQIYQTIEP